MHFCVMLINEEKPVSLDCVDQWARERGLQFENEQRAQGERVGPPRLAPALDSAHTHMHFTVCLLTKGWTCPS